MSGFINNGTVFSVSDVNNRIKELLDSHYEFKDIYIQGEISNYKLHSSNHHYMTLKDKDSVLSAVLFARDAANLRFKLENGMKIIARGRISSFIRNGQYQMYISDVIPDGVGALQIAYEQLKQKLYSEGLFSDAYKKPLPQYPSNVAIITSPTGAAVCDMIRILRNRYPMCSVSVIPVLVQGPGAAEDIAMAIELANKHNIGDVIIVGRGGGSIEDLWAFNEECVARAIFKSVIPIVSAVGHEPDYTISDFVADVRAATPSNAAEIIVPDRLDILSYMKSSEERLIRCMDRLIKSSRDRILSLNNRHNSKNPRNYIEEKRMLLGHINQKLITSMEAKISGKRQHFIKNTAYLDAYSPLKVLSRGYAIVENEDGNIVKDRGNISIGSKLSVKVSKAVLKCEVLEIKGEKNGKTINI